MIKVRILDPNTIPGTSQSSAATRQTSTPQDAPFDTPQHPYPATGHFFWQWPNLLALDAVIVAITWQLAAASTQDLPLQPAQQIVLALSVWLCYMADRLFDVQRHPSHSLLTSRHQFANTHKKHLWQIWWTILVINCSIAFFCLTANDLFAGFILLLLCLIYTSLNQKLSKYFFPKEILVAIIFSAGVFVFLPGEYLWGNAIALSSLCFTNCILISKKEEIFDRLIGDRSLTILPFSWVIVLSTISTIFFSTLFAQELRGALLLSLGILIFFQITAGKIGNEIFRVGIDIVLLIGPIYILFVDA